MDVVIEAKLFPAEAPEVDLDRFVDGLVDLRRISSAALRHERRTQQRQHRRLRARGGNLLQKVKLLLGVFELVVRNLALDRAVERREVVERPVLLVDGSRLAVRHNRVCKVACKLLLVRKLVEVLDVLRRELAGALNHAHRAREHLLRAARDAREGARDAVEQLRVARLLAIERSEELVEPLRRRLLPPLTREEVEQRDAQRRDVLRVGFEDALRRLEHLLPVASQHQKPRLLRQRGRKPRVQHHHLVEERDRLVVRLLQLVHLRLPEQRVEVLLLALVEHLLEDALRLVDPRFALLRRLIILRELELEPTGEALRLGVARLRSQNLIHQRLRPPLCLPLLQRIERRRHQQRRLRSLALLAMQPVLQILNRFLIDDLAQLVRSNHSCNSRQLHIALPEQAFQLPQSLAI
mmetsp:Transcript_25637/g.84406  ORF Transcript_25637/g.84406 Transcript_25637/m.84406 type:complete len:409 (-) Transcript_25637:185-1411(-)